MVNPVTPTRFQLQKVAGDDFELLRALESLFRVAGTETLERLDSAEAMVARAMLSGAYAGQVPGTTGLDSEDTVFVSDKTDFPAPVGGVITLVDGVTYVVTGVVDLEGDRLVAGVDTVILGWSSENCRIKSTGLTDALVTSVWSLPMRHITLEADVCLDLDGGANQPDVALDWYGVNFEGGAVGRIANCSNFIYSTGAFLGVSGLTISGTIGTVGLNNSLFAGSGSGPIIDIDASAVITRRFKVVESAVIAPDVGFSLDPGASIPDEAFILETVNFGGGGTPLAGIDETSVKAFFSNCAGIINTSNVAQYYMNNNATTTTIAAANTPVKIAGVTTESPVTQGFTHTDNRATYARAIPRTFKVVCTATLSSGSNNSLALRIYKNGAQVAGGVSIGTAGTGGRAENITVISAVAVEGGDYIEVWAENRSGTTDILASELNILIGGL